MENWQTTVVGLYGLTALLLSVLGFYQSHWNKNTYGNFYLAAVIGAFVWADTTTLGLFWFFVSLGIIYRHDWILFLLLISLFWTVRSMGEALWSMNEESHPRNLYKPESFPLFVIFKDRSVFFVNQVIWQCLTVLSLLVSLYLGKLWLGRI